MHDDFFQGKSDQGLINWPHRYGKLSSPIKENKKKRKKSRCCH